MTDCQYDAHRHTVDLAMQRGQLLRYMTDKWAETHVRFVERQRSQSKKIEELQIRERTLTWRFQELTPRGGGVTAPASGFHQKRGVALNRTTCTRLEGGRIRTLR